MDAVFAVSSRPQLSASAFAPRICFEIKNLVGVP